MLPIRGPWSTGPRRHSRSRSTGSAGRMSSRVGSVPGVRRLDVTGRRGRGLATGSGRWRWHEVVPVGRSCGDVTAEGAGEQGWNAFGALSCRRPAAAESFGRSRPGLLDRPRAHGACPYSEYDQVAPAMNTASTMIIVRPGCQPRFATPPMSGGSAVRVGAELAAGVVLGLVGRRGGVMLVDAELFGHELTTRCRDPEMSPR